MNVSALASAASANVATVQAQASLLVLKKAMDLQQANAAQLLKALPPASGPTPGATVGGTIDTFV
ncbi:YjfB family protein [Aromatoleum diolicum]|uniref:Motility protein n=1 Tax=Aromatoleum diolicum TaxID=75796 RepID=A0ABX1QBH5_9RHOO|nr:YjfB family protein [Aromatoleum diolicum]NMG74519.1 putative motility protein [Aromatoleum diolicum]